MPAAAHKPELDEEVIRVWLRENFSVAGHLDPLPGESDLNFKLSTDQGESLICKFSSSSGEELELLAAQNEVLTFLNRRDLAAIPKVVASDRGESLVPLDDGDQTYVGRVLGFVPGEVLAKCAPYRDALLQNLGTTLGRINQALAGYDQAAFHYQSDWDLANSMAVVRRYRDLIADPQVRDAVDRIAEDFNNIAAPRFGQLRQSVIHNDANDYNILAEGDRVTGIIDFGDMVHTFTICDLAIAMAYATLGAEDVLGAITGMANGYHREMPIGADERAVLFPMLRMRLAVSACMAAHQRRLRPNDPYLAISQEPIRNTLPKLMALDVDEVQSQLEESLA